MRHLNIVPAIVVLVACAGKPEPPRIPAAPRPPVGLIGAWVRLTPRRLHGDTLLLRADSSADGLILWDPGKDARAKRWLTRFGSHEPVATREDTRRGYQDGGDADCQFGKVTAGCVSMPIVCIGAPGQYACNAFKYVAPDSLFLADGSSFVKASTSRGGSARDRLTGR
jgi:hypothetical protein